MKIEKLDKIIKKVAPIHGVNSDGVISFKDEATVEEIAVANSIVSAFMANEPDDDCLTWNGTEFVPDMEVCKEELYNKISKKQKNVEKDGFLYAGNYFDFDDKTLYVIGSRLSLTRDLMIDGVPLTSAQLTFYDSGKNPVVFLSAGDFIDFCRAYINARNKIDQRRIVLKAMADVIQSEEDEGAVETAIEIGWV